MALPKIRGRLNSKIMAKNPFSAFKGYVNKPKRNSFDLSFANNLTLKIGALTPVFCKEVIPGDSFKIQPRVGLQFMPSYFPVQTPIKAYMHFFYVRNRTLWKDWMDFIGNTKTGLVPPYLALPEELDTVKHALRTGGLLDYMGVPITTYGEYGNSSPLTPSFKTITKQATADGVSIENTFLRFRGLHVLGSETSRPNLLSSTVAPFSAPNLAGTINLSPAIGVNVNDSSSPYSFKQYASATYNSELNSCNPVMCLGSFNGAADKHVRFDFKEFICLQFVVVSVSANIIQSFTVDEVPESVKDVECFDQNITYYVFARTALRQVHEIIDNVDTIFYDNFPEDLSVRTYSLTEGVNNVGDYQSNPYFNLAGRVERPIRINALPFRAYEAIYNAFYRNMENNPFMVNGLAEYNKYIPTNEGGADYSNYDIHYRNWETDFLTSAVQTPQQGQVAPLVGMTMTGSASFQDEDGNTFYAQAEYDDNGVITGWSSHSSDMPVGTLRMLSDMVGTGISINDLRNVNSLQRWLENNIRKGLKYKDQIKSHFGVDTEFKELDMPEFIGGMSCDVKMQMINQMSNDAATPMGSFAGIGSAYDIGHDITHYCDEHGYIIGILSVVPRPVYSQLLPKHLIKDNVLDYFFPEFGHIGYQPIFQKEVSPLQTYYDVMAAGGADESVFSKAFHEVFGYQRAWYDYLASVDEVHGQFRTTFRDFLMNRTFASKPQLNEDFLLVDPKQLNDVFLVTDDSEAAPEYSPDADKIIGSCFFEVSAKRPIPKFGIPRLE